MKEENVIATKHKLKNKKSKSNTLFIIIGSVFLLFIASYIAFSFYFRNHFFPNTYISGLDCSYKTVAQVEEIVRVKIENYELELFGRDDIYDTIGASEIDLIYKVDDSLSKILANQKQFLWGKGLFVKNDYDIPHAVEFDRDKLWTKLGETSLFFDDNIRKPQDAVISEFDEDSNSYQIIKEDIGTTLLIEKTREMISTSIDNLEETIDLEEQECYLNPKVYEDNKELINVRNTLNQYVSSTITIETISGDEKLTGEEINKWLSVSENSVLLDEEAAREYVNSVSREHDTYGRKRKFKTTSGNEIELPSGGYGWRTDRAEETKEIIKLVKNGETTKREPIYSVRGYAKGANDIGDTYIEIDLGKQHLYVYDKGNLYHEEDFVSGNMSKGWSTPAGVFGLTYKTKNAVLRGENYETPVNFWMPFNGNVGMHDATWRNKFGGEIYITNGSHGCVNLPIGSAEKIYNFVEQGMPIICYY